MELIKTAIGFGIFTAIVFGILWGVAGSCV